MRLQAMKTEAGGGDRRSMVDAAYTQLKRQIMYNELPPGFRALEEELALRLGMSRTPIREALIRLEQEGFIELIPRRGMRVKALSAKDIRDITEVLSCLEVAAAEKLASRKPGPAEIARLEEAIAGMDRALDGDDRAAWAEADYRFHCLLVELCDNQQLVAVARNFLDKAHRFRLMTVNVRAKPVYSNVNHAAVVEAIRRGDPQTAVEIHRAHKRRWVSELATVLERLGMTD
jgi:DNA-binding GntR family transcriptional regulator